MEQLSRLIIAIPGTNIDFFCKTTEKSISRNYGAIELRNGIVYSIPKASEVDKEGEKSEKSVRKRNN